MKVSNRSFVTATSNPNQRIGDRLRDWVKCSRFWGISMVLSESIRKKSEFSIMKKEIKIKQTPLPRSNKGTS